MTERMGIIMTHTDFYGTLIYKPNLGQKIRPNNNHKKKKKKKKICKFVHFAVPGRPQNKTERM